MVGFVLGYIVNDKLSERDREETMFESAREKVERDSELEDLRFKADEAAKSYKYAAPGREESFDEDDDLAPDDDEPVQEPIVITEDEFDHDYLQAETIGLTYYQKDDVLTDGDGEPIYEIHDTIGEEGEWAAQNTEDDTVYVYNDELDTKYEITVDHYSSFYESDGMKEE